MKHNRSGYPKTKNNKAKENDRRGAEDAVKVIRKEKASMIR